MTKQDWIAQFEAANGRSPEQSEIDAALAAGEFAEAAESQEQGGTEAQETAETPAAAAEAEEKAAETAAATTEEVAQEAAPAQEEKALVQEAAAQSQPEAAAAEQANSGAAPQPTSTPAPAQPSEFSKFTKQFWDWFRSALKAPTAAEDSHKYNGLTAYAILVLTITLTVMTPIWRASLSYDLSYVFSGSLVSAFFGTLVGSALLIFGVILGGFVVKHFVYQENDFTLGKAFDWYGRLFAINILICLAMIVFILLGVTTLSIWLGIAAYLLFAAAIGYSIFPRGTASNIDGYHRYLLGIFVYSIILVVFSMIAFSISGEILGRGIIGDFTNFTYYNY